MKTENQDDAVVRAFGQEWQAFDQSKACDADLQMCFSSYFAIFPWHRLGAGARGFDLGCGSGRWARFVAPRVGELHCVDASADALEVARRNLSGLSQVRFHHASVDVIPFPDNSMDFGYSLGVLHHLPDTKAGLLSCVRKLRRGAPFLVYLYYAFDNRPVWFRLLWRCSDLLRRWICQLPFFLKRVICELFAVAVYWPLARVAGVGERLGFKVANWPLSAYRNVGLYIMRTDALDRFGTRLERRFTRREIRAMMEDAGLVDIVFHDAVPCWCALGYRA